MKPFIKDGMASDLLEKMGVFSVFILMSTKLYYGIRIRLLTAERYGTTKSISVLIILIAHRFKAKVDRSP